MMGPLIAEVYVVLISQKSLNRMTWEETIIQIRTQPEFRDLVRLAYFDEDLSLNVDRFGKSEEFKETLKLITAYQPKATQILDIGSGNGISVVNFALKGYQVTTVEPDTSETVGYGAICKLKEHYKLENITAYNAFAEDIAFPDATFDVVYIRQAMHHANNLEKFIKECVRVLKPGGLLLTTRDHVVFSEKDKKAFLNAHPLQKYYGGENAFTPLEYQKAITDAGASIQKEYKYYDTVINYFPRTIADLNNDIAIRNNKLKKHLCGKIGVLASFPFIFELYKWVKGIDVSDALDETKIPGRMYSYVAIKK